MTEEAKALVERVAMLPDGNAWPSTVELLCDLRDFIEAQAAEIEKLREALKEVFEAWAGSEDFIPETAPEGYLLYLTKRMAHIARAALEAKP